MERYIERLSEASRHLPAELKGRHPEIDWVGVASIGNVLRHIYDQVIAEEIWKVVTDDLEPLRRAIERIAAAIDEQEE